MSKPRSTTVAAALVATSACLALAAPVPAATTYRSMVGNGVTGGTTPSPIAAPNPATGPASPITGGGTPGQPGPADTSVHAALRGNGMWIWQIPRSNGGSIDSIARQAKAAGVGTLFIKSADSTGTWRQFTRAMIDAFHARGLKVCGWHYVYGRYPMAEAAASAYAKTQGADCFVIDAEAEYEGRYVAASIYTRELRRLVGAAYPVGLAPFPYVDYHPGFPYSVFLGPGAAQYNLPQMYWKAIGTTVSAVFAHTYRQSAIYNRPILPLGQTYQSPTAAELNRFRALSRANGAAGLSWWDWQETTTAGWKALASRFMPVASAPDPGSPTLGLQSKGDQVVWAQMLLAASGQPLKVDGIFAASTRSAVRAFQAARGLPVTGGIGDKTWTALRRFTPRPIALDKLQPASKPGLTPARASSAQVPRGGPATSTLPARAYEIPPSGRLSAR